MTLPELEESQIIISISSEPRKLFVAELRDLLIRCFSSVFPTLTSEEIRGADVASLFDFDSLAGVTLLTVIGEEFGVNLDLSDLLKLGSFETICRHLHEQAWTTPQREWQKE